MTTAILLVAFTALISAACGFLFIPSILNFCKRRGLYDIPNTRKVHKVFVPRLGGVAFIPSMMLAAFIVLTLWGSQQDRDKLQVSLWTIAFSISILLIYCVGLIDDVMGLGAKVKFAVQLVAAALLPASGLYINNLYGAFGIHEIPFCIGAPLTVFAIVFIDNAINLIDGIDGLAASLSIIALCGFLRCFWKQDMLLYCTLIAGLTGVLVAYFYYNVFGKAEQNRKVFMGDCGSLTLGFILGFLFVKYTMDNPCVMAYREDRLIAAGSMLIVPVFDAVRVILHRLHSHKLLFDADKSHIHHKLLAAGLSMRQTLLAIILLALLFIAVNIMLFPMTGTTTVIVVDIILYTVFHLAVNRTLAKP